MPKAISAERWAAARALMRLEPPTQARVAAAMGVNTSTLAKHFGAQGFEVLDYRRADIVAAHEELRVRLIDRFVRGVIDAPVPVETLAMDAINGMNGAVDGPTEPQPGFPLPAPVAETAEPEIGRAERVSRMLLRHADQLIAQWKRKAAH